MDAICDQLTDMRIVIEIVRQLERDGLRARPFPLSHVPQATAADLHKVATAEVRKVVRGLPPIARNGDEDAPQRAQRDGDDPVAHIRSIIRGLRRYVELPGVWPAISTLEVEVAKRQAPSWHNVRKLQCVREAFYLVDTLCRIPPTGSRTGPFMKVAELLYEATTGGEAADLYQICRTVLKDRRDVGLGTTEQDDVPPIF